MRRARNFILKVSRKVSNFSRGIALVAASLFGIRQTDENKLSLHQLYMALVAWLIITPIGLLIIGPTFSSSLCAGIILTILAVSNMDSCYELICILSDYGVKNTPAYQAWLNN